ncbi:MAG: 30S ribosomal protein S12 methylthiotransferase RimO [Lachnospiraceae bacterium]|nr:30S ribosomal protein S12 methylthiotransferase RimO [Lachnospiraceae bacterium]
MKVAFISLGCDKNTVDTEMMLGMLNDAGHELVYEEEEADAVVINTCAFILDAKKESIDNILRVGELKREGKVKYIIVTGCLGQRYTDEIKEDIPEVDAIVGIQSFDKIIEVIEDLDNKETVAQDKTDALAAQDDKTAPIVELAPLNEKPIHGKKRLLTTPIHYAYLKIAEGCSKGCTYCIIPSLRGTYRSVPKEALIKEAEDLANRGVKELILVAQETTVYGTDIYGKKVLPDLIRGLAAIEGIEHIRLLYCYPEEIDDELIELMKSEPKLYHYLDMPIQHASDKILKSMGRKATEAGLRELIGKLRKEIPDIVVRTTLISGFPGETISDYLTLKRFVKDMRFDRLGVFAYSEEEGTIAAKMPHKKPQFVKEYRKNAIMKLQRDIIYAANEAMKGSELDVVIQGRLPEDEVYVARSYRDAPDVDGNVFIQTDREFISGDNIRVKITQAAGYDLIAVPVS